MRHADITLIFVHALNAARNYFEERGAMPVFAYVLPADEPDQLRRVVTGGLQGSGAREVVEQLKVRLKQEARAEGYRAVPIVTAESEAGDNGSEAIALQVAVDHATAGAVVWRVPIRCEGGRYEFGARDGGGDVREGERFIFG